MKEEEEEEEEEKKRALGANARRDLRYGMMKINPYSSMERRASPPVVHSA
jgi:hypothetical protein